MAQCCCLRAITVQRRCNSVNETFFANVDAAEVHANAVQGFMAHCWDALLLLWLQVDL
jgi:hypothetical protein